MEANKEEIWARRHNRERAARKEAEKLLEVKSLELYASNESLRQLTLDLEVRVREATEEMWVQESKFRTLFEHSFDGILLRDMEGRILEANQEISRMLGINRERLMELEIEEMHPAEALAGCMEAMQVVLETGYHRFETMFSRADGSTFPAEVSASKLEIGGALAVQGIIRDISKQKRQEEALRSARDEAQQANDAKSLFLANMSHEIRTPMNGIIGMTELVLNSELTSTQRDYLETVIESSESLLRIINEILDFSKIEAGHFSLETVPFALRDAIGEALKSQALRAHAKHLELAWHVAKDVPDSLLGDAGRLRQIIVNLVGNAIKFTAEGEIEVDVDKVSENKGQVDWQQRIDDCSPRP